jgi:hypothetical protein
MPSSMRIRTRSLYRDTKMPAGCPHESWVMPRGLEAQERRGSGGEVVGTFREWGRGGILWLVTGVAMSGQFVVHRVRVDP